MSTIPLNSIAPPIPKRINQPFLSHHSDEGTKIYNIALGGLSGIVAAFTDGADMCKKMVHSINIRDIEGIIDTLIRLIAAPFHFGNGVGTLIWYVESFIPFTNQLLQTATSLCGVLLSLFESIYETLNIQRSLIFQKRLKTDLLERLNDSLSLLKHPEMTRDPLKTLITSLENDQKWDEIFGREKTKEILLNLNKGSIQEALLNITALKGEFLKHQLLTLQKNLQTPPPWSVAKIKIFSQKHFASIKNVLATNHRHKFNRRVQKETVEEFAIKAPKVLYKLKTEDQALYDEGVIEAENLLYHLKDQSRRKMTIHLIGLASLTIIGVGWGLLTAGFPPLLPFTLIFFGTVGGYMRLGLKNALKKGGWRFHLKDQVPRPFYRLIEKVRGKNPSISSTPKEKQVIEAHQGKVT